MVSEAGVRVVVVVSAVVALLMCAVPAAGREGEVPAGLGGRVDAHVEEFRERQGLGGVAVVVVHRGRVVHAAGYGRDALGRPVTADSVMPVASLSKSMTAAAVLRLVEEGLLGLDDPVVEHLPAFDPVDPRGRRITVRHLLEQTSGLASQGLLSPDRAHKESLDDAVRILSGMGLAAEPGTAHRYFNGNYWLAAALVQEVAGVPFADALQDRVFAPLGMGDSASVSAGAAVEGMAPGHLRVLGMRPVRALPPDLSTGSGEVVSTARDLGRWLAPYTGAGRAASGEVFLSRASVREALAPGTAGGDYTLGWRLLDDGRWAHGGTEYSHLAQQLLSADGEWGVAVLDDTFSYLDTAYPLAAGVLDLAQGRDPAPRPPANLYLDLALGAGAASSAVVGAVRLRRARVWGGRLAVRPRWRALVASVPVLVPAGVVVWLVVLGAASGAHPRTVWAVLSGGLVPAGAMVWLAVAALSGVVVAAVRWRARARARAGAGQV